LSGRLPLNLAPDSQLARIFGRPTASEAHTCSFELNPDLREQLVATGLRVAAVDALGAVRAVELPDRRFFVATLFLPQYSSSARHPHPLIAAYLRAARKRPSPDITIPTPPRQ
jgi:CTP synthase (UTP-ammonia lyase)